MNHGNSWSVFSNGHSNSRGITGARYAATPPVGGVCFIAGSRRWATNATEAIVT